MITRENLKIAVLKNKGEYIEGLSISPNDYFSIDFTINSMGTQTTHNIKGKLWRESGEVQILMDACGIPVSSRCKNMEEINDIFSGLIFV